MRGKYEEKKTNGILSRFPLTARWKCATIILSVFVVVGTVLALMFPGVTQNQYRCGIQEHTHSTKCYTLGNELICTEDHAHNSNCYIYNVEVLVCGMTEHAHDDTCREPELTPEEQRDVETVVFMISALPDIRQVRAEMQRMDEAGDEAALQAYRLKLSNNINQIRSMYSELTARQKAAVTNADVLEAFVRLMNTNNAYLANSGDVSAMVTLDNRGSMIPGAEFCVSQMGQDTEEYRSAATKVENYVAGIGGSLQDLTVLDMHFADASGQEFAPNGYATVTLSFAAPILPGDGAVRVYHITESGVEDVTGDMVRTEEGVTALTIRTRGFSPYVVASSDFQVTILDSGHVDNGTEEGINWQVQTNDDGSRSLIFSGTGPIPDYTENARGPWHSYRNGGLIDLVIGEGITVLGNYSLKNFSFSSVQWPSSLHTLGTQCFGYMGGSTMPVWNIPGTVKTIMDSAFIYCGGAYTFILNEGTEYIGSAGLGSQSTNGSCVITIPSTVSHIGIDPFWTASEIRVAEGNPYFKSIDGVLYSMDGKTLLDYPNNRVTDCFVVPSHVETVESDVFKNIKATTKAIRIEHVVKFKGSQFFRNSAFREVWIADGNNISSGWLFVGDGQLESVRLPENTPLSLGGSALGSCPSLVELKIPNGTTYLGDAALSKANALTELYWDAAKADVHRNVIPADSIAVSFNLTVGQNVDYLYADFNALVSHSETLNFDLENTFYVEPGALASAAEPLCNLEGWVHVCSQGDIYLLDVETKQATLFYQLPGYDEMRLDCHLSLQRRDPQTNEVLDEEYEVVGVSERALRDSNAKTLVLEDASKVQFLRAYAFADAPIDKVVDLATNVTVTTVEEAQALFTGATQGYGIFNNTNLGNAPSVGPNFENNMNGTQGNVYADNLIGGSILVEIQKGETTYWQPNEEVPGTGGWVSLTGDPLAINVTAANNAGGDSTYRLYLRWTNEQCSLNYTPGEEYMINGVRVVCYATENPDEIYLEYTNSSEEALNFTLYAHYPSPTGHGGGLEVRAAVMKGDQEIASGEKIQASWHVSTLQFQVDKQHTNSNTGVLTITGENDRIVLSTDLLYKIFLRTTNLEEVHENFGLNIVKNMDFEDILTLPEGMTWDPEVLQAIADGNTIANGGTIYLGYVGGRQLVTINNLPTGVALQNPRLSINEQGQVVLRWRIKNTMLSALHDYSCQLIINRSTVKIDLSVLDVTTAVVRNDISATVNYTHTDAQVSTSSVDKTFSKVDGKIEVSISDPEAIYFGETLHYLLSVYNKGGLTWYASDPGVHTLKLPLSEVSCIYPEDMERMFLEAVEEGQKLKTPLTITIEHATLGSYSSALGTDGSSPVLLHSNNTYFDDRYMATLTVTYDPVTGQYTVTAVPDSGAAPVTGSGPDLEDVLWRMGFGITRESKFTCVWQLSDGEQLFSLTAGQSVNRIVYAHAKNTFQYIGMDWPNEYIRDASVLVQPGVTEVLNSQSKQVAKVRAPSTQVRREAYIDKSVYKNGVTLGSNPTAKDQDILEYRLRFTHYGSGTYDDLPMVDALCGSQYLLVPVEYNPKLADLGLEICTYGEMDWYVLTEGTYYNVYVGRTADGTYLNAYSVKVHRGENLEILNGGETMKFSGILTEIKWYYAHRDGGRYSDNISYFAKVGTENAPSYTIGNQVWMNDVAGSRIYDGLWGGGTLIDFDKQIVTERGDTPGRDVLDDDQHLPVGEGESVTYRLELSSNGNSGSFTLNGEFLTDALPNTFNQFQWDKSRISVEVVPAFRGNEGELNSVTGWHDMDESFYLQPEYKTLGGGGAWFMCWDNDANPDNANGFNLVFRGNATIYLYVTVTFPSEAQWDDYVEAASGAQLSNTLYVHLNPATVTHVLKEPGAARIQKGVYAMASSETLTGTSYIYVSGMSRQVYNNRDVVSRYAVYYVSVYNGGNTRLYLSNVEDLLPEGFTFKALVPEDYADLNRFSHGNRRSVLTGGGHTSNFLTGTQGITFRSATVRTEVDPLNSRHITFSFDAGAGEYPVNYDEDRNQFYLGKDEAIVFAYAADIDVAGKTRDIATNTVAMPYTDYTGAGVTLTENGKVMADRVSNEHYADQNDDGGCSILTASQAEGYGFPGSQEDTWLKSEVSLVRGSIRPGIHKQTVSFRSSENEPDQPYTNSVTHHDIVNWRITFFNGGETSIVDYTITDVMPNPYVFKGPVTYSIRDDTGREVLAKETLFTVRDVPVADLASINSLTEVVITDYNGNDHTVTIGGPPVRIDKRYANDICAWVSFHWDENGNLAMTLDFEDAAWAVPSGGYLTLDYSSYNPTNSVATMTYLNEVQVYPSQPFRYGDIHFGTAITDENGKPVGVKNLSPLTVVAGVATDAYKDVAETGNPQNSVSSEITNSDDSITSNSTDKYIVVAGADREFTFGLAVINGTEANPALGTLVLIDNLPFVGDAYAFNSEIARNSEFAVRPSDTPDFKVTVTRLDGTVVTLDPGTYVVQYSTKRSDFTEADRKGRDSQEWINADQWTLGLDQVGSIRVIITDTGAQTDERIIPPGSTVKFSFDAVATGRVETGATAWNNFGYHAKVFNGSAELEAMPLTVGVRMASEPLLYKDLTTVNGTACTLPEDQTFRFLVYTGQALGGTYASQEELLEALTAAGRLYKIWDLTLPAGQSYSSDKGLKLSETPWNWTVGDQYTIVELLDSEDFSHRTWMLNGERISDTRGATFTYRQDIFLNLTCVNAYLLWDLELYKESSVDQTRLAGGVFAVYGRADLGFTYEGAAPWVEIAGERWYLHSVKTTDANGTALFDRLDEEHYYLVEVRAPNGYRKDPTPVMVSRPAADRVAYLTVQNDTGTILPSTGGIGEVPYQWLGLVLLTVSCILMYVTLRKRRREVR